MRVMRVTRVMSVTTKFYLKTGGMIMQDLIIIGAGPAGVSAALYAQSRGLSLTIFEKDRIGGLIGKVSKVSHYTSVVVDETGPEFAARLKNQIEAYGLKVIKEEVTGLSKTDAGFTVQTAAASYTAKKVIIATGSTPKELPLNTDGYKIAHWTLGTEEKCQHKTVIINGGSDGAAKEALHILPFAKAVHMVQNMPQILCIAEFKKQLEADPKLHVHCGTSLASLTKTGSKVTTVKLADGTEITDANGIEIFAMIGQTPATSFIKLDLPRNEQGFLADEVKTGIDGLYVAGDVRAKTVRQVATAVNDGCLAGIMAAAK